MFRELLSELLGHAGAEYCCVADASLGKVVEEAGARSDEHEKAALAMLGWGSSAATLLSGSAADELDDLIVTTRRAYHLVRALDPGSGRPLLIYLRVDRRRGNLAAARRGLAAARPGAPQATVPVQRSESVVVRGIGGSAAVPSARGGLAVVPEPTAPSALPAPSAPSVSSAPPMPKAPSARTTSSVRPGGVVALPRRQPAAPPAPRRPPPSPVVRSAAESGTAGLGPVDGRWHTDTGTLERLLRALRRMA